jgi:hypothetical protein
MYPSTEAKQYGLTLVEIESLTSFKVRTLQNWFKKDRRKWETALRGAMILKHWG